MIATLIKSTILIGFAAAVVWLLRRKSAALRHAVWTAGLIAAMAVPLSSLLLPSWHAPVLGTAETWIERTAVPGIEGLLGEKSPSGEPTGGSSTSGKVLELVSTVWLVGSGLALLLLLLGAFRLGIVVLRSRPFLDPRWNRIANEVSQAFGLSRPVELLENSRVAFLGTWGIIRPRVLVPSSSLDWSDDRIRMVLGHELAHVKRHDWVIQVLAEAARAIYWFNPMFWIAHREIRRESEHACDDCVLRMGAVGPEYAEQLLEVTRALRRGSTFRSPILAMTQPSHLERRLVALLNPSINRLAATPWAVVLVVGAAIAVTLPLAAIRGRGLPEKESQGSDLSTKPDGSGHKTLPADPDSGSDSAKIDSVTANSPTTSNSRALAANRPKRKAPRACRPTPSVRRTRTVPQKLVPFGNGPWHISKDSVIWVWDQPYVAGIEINTIWLRPPGTVLGITGKRLDGSSAPLEVKASSDYQAGYVATPLIFPTAGCWQITAVSGTSKLTFITQVKSSSK